MVQANERPNKTHDRLIKKLNRLKTDLNNEGIIDTNLTKRQLRSRTLVTPTPRVPSPSQMTTMDTTGTNSNIPQIEQDPPSPRFHSSENKGSTKTLRVTELELQQVTIPIKNQALLLNPLKLISINWKLKKSISKDKKWKSVF